MPLFLVALLFVTGCFAAMAPSNPHSGRIGVRYEACTTARGNLVSHVEPGLAAARVGIQPGDVLESVGGVLLDYHTPLSTALYHRQPGEPVEIVFHRDGQRYQVMETLDPPAAVSVQAQGYSIGGCDWGLPAITRRPTGEARRL